MSRVNQNQFGDTEASAASPHTPVLVREVIQYLSPKAGESYLDVTAGYGGHFKAVAERTLKPARAVLVDQDAEAVVYLEQHFAKTGVRIIHQDFLGASRQLLGQDQRFDMILADLGLSSPHLNITNRGFAIGLEGPLDMRMDQRRELTADIVINRYDEVDLAEIIGRYGEEPRAKSIAKRIVRNRPISSTQQLAKVVSGAWPARSRRHPATRTFQAIRIAVNDELNQLESSLPIWLELLAPGGRLVLISFHSLEDRLVKNFFTEHASGSYDGEIDILTKKPVIAEPEEIVLNPRARSAKLRAAVKIKTKRKE